MPLGLQVAFDGKRSASRDALLQEVFGSFEGIVIVKAEVRRVEAGYWGFGLRLRLDPRLGRGRGERERFRTGAGKQ
jgi:hypothetical protein